MKNDYDDGFISYSYGQPGEELFLVYNRTKIQITKF